MSDDRYSQIASGARGATGDAEWQKLVKFVKGLFPSKPEKRPVIAEEGNQRGLSEEIAGVARMVREPASSSADWDNVYQDWMDGAIDIEDMEEGQLQSIYDELRGYEGQDPETMIEELTTYRDRYWNR